MINTVEDKLREFVLKFSFCRNYCVARNFFFRFWQNVSRLFSHLKTFFTHLDPGHLVCSRFAGFTCDSIVSYLAVLQTFGSVVNRVDKVIWPP